MKAIVGDCKEIAGKTVKANPPFVTVTENKVKLCGYLKKKRNKVGGWRKLWFVLQDKLLLSYSSKEEYDNKLVSFKDVLNLVPGTMVRPLGGFRFTIETTSLTLYTFHCDDRIAYREWMSKLLDSLASTPQSTAQHQFAYKRFDNTYVTPVCSASMDSIPQAMVDGYLFQRNAPVTRRAFATRSYDSITQVEHRLSTTKMDFIRCPVSLQQVKFLEHNGADSNTNQQGLKVFYNRKLNDDILLKRKTFDSVKNYAQRRSIKGSKDSYMLDEHSLKNKQTQPPQSNENMLMRVKHLTIIAQENKLHYDIAKNTKKNCRSCHLEQMDQHNQCMNSKLKFEPVYAIVDLQHKYAQRRIRSNKSDNRITNDPKRCNSYDNIIQYRMYADQLKNSKRSSYEKDNIYDDGDQLACKVLTQQQLQPLGVHVNTTQNVNDDTIYDPINISAAYGSANRAFWAYFTQFKVKPLLQFTHFNRRSQCSDYDVIKLPAMRSNFGTPSFNLQNANIKHTLGSQRNSIRARLRNLCKRSSYGPKPFCNGSVSTGNCITGGGSSLPSTPNDTTVRVTPQPSYVKNKIRFINQWRTIKLRSKNTAAVSPIPAIVNDTVVRAKRRLFVGSLPHLRKRALRFLLPSRPQQHKSNMTGSL